MTTIEKCNHPIEDFCVRGGDYVCAKCGEVLKIDVPTWASHEGEG